MTVLRYNLLRQNVRQAITWQRTRSLALSIPELPHYRRYFRRSAYRPAAKRPWFFYPSCVVLLGVAGLVGYHTSQPLRHTVLAVVRCSRVAGESISFKTRTAASRFVGAAIFSSIDYQLTMNGTHDSAEHEAHAYSECHTRSAKRVLKALLANGGLISGVYAKAEV